MYSDIIILTTPGVNNKSLGNYKKVPGIFYNLNVLEILKLKLIFIFISLEVVVMNQFDLNGPLHLKTSNI